LVKQLEPEADNSHPFISKVKDG